MTTSAPVLVQSGPAPPPRRRRRFWRHQPPLLVAGVVMVSVLALVALFGPWLAPHDPHALTGRALERPSARHLLGTNDIGQDIASEVVIGTRASLATAVPAAALAVILGIAVGMGAALRGGWVGIVSMRVVDGFLAIPGLPLVVLLAALAGPSRLAVVLILASAGWPAIARILYGQTLELRGRGFVRNARGFGGSTRYIIRRHLVPAMAPTVVAGFVQWAATAVVVQTGLNFLGLGDPTTVSWGSILNRALEYQGLYYSNLWIWWVLPAGAAITMATLGFTFIGIGLEPRFNPAWRRSL